MNLGAIASQGVALLFLHADVKVPADFLKEIEVLMCKHDIGCFAHKFQLDRKLFSYQTSLKTKKVRFTGWEG